MIVVVNAFPLDIVPTFGLDGTDAVCATSPVNVAVALAGLRQSVGLLTLDDSDAPGAGPAAELPASFAVATHARADEQVTLEQAGEWRWAAADVPDQFGSPTIALHTCLPEAGSAAVGLDRICVRERQRAQVTVSLDLRADAAMLDDVEAAQAWALSRIRSADIVTANANDLAYLYPGVSPVVIAQYWREEGVACSAITSDDDGVLLVAPNGLAYRRTVATEPSVDMTPAAGAFTAGLLAGLAGIGALGSSPRARLDDVRSQQWLSVLERADTAARSHAARDRASRHHVRTGRSTRSAVWRRPASALS